MHLKRKISKVFKFYQWCNMMDQLKPMCGRPFILIIVVLFNVVCFLGFGCSSKEGQFLVRGERFLNMSRGDLAIGQFNKAIESNPSSYPAYCGRARAYSILAEFDKASYDINMAIKLDPNLPDAYYYRANIYYMKRQLVKSLVDLNKAIDIASIYPEFFCMRGTIHSEYRNFDLALKDFTECIYMYEDSIDMQKNVSKAYVGRAVVWFGKRQHDNAIKDLNEALRINPKYAEAFYFGSIVREDQGNIPKALQNMERYMEIVPEDNEGKKRVKRLKLKLTGRKNNL